MCDNDMSDGVLPLAITMGDPAGIGPEIAVKALSSPRFSGSAVVLGDPLVMEQAVESFGGSMRLQPVDNIDCAAPGFINVLPTSDLAAHPGFGEVDALCGKAAFDAITAGIDLAKRGVVSGIVTAPINKEAFSAASIPFPGHTEILAERGGADRVAMMLANDELRTVLVTIHCSLRDAIERADFDAQMSAIRLADEGGRRLGIGRPRVAVAGLNPHAGEGGLFGDEEIRIIGPAIEAAREEGIDVSGPWPGDTVFMQARKGRFDVVVAQYHDQGLIPVKYMGLEKGVNITLGLPFVRTSPDHGTAFDIAGKGIADETSLLTAIAYANQMIGASARRGA